MFKNSKYFWKKRIALTLVTAMCMGAIYQPAYAEEILSENGVSEETEADMLGLPEAEPAGEETPDTESEDPLGTLDTESEETPGTPDSESEEPSDTPDTESEETPDAEVLSRDGIDYSIHDGEDGYLDIPDEMGDLFWPENVSLMMDDVEELGATELEAAYGSNPETYEIQLPSYLQNIPLKDQGSNNICWAMSSIALAEISMAKQGYNLSPDYSEAALAYFSYNTATDPLGNTAGDVNSQVMSGGIYRWSGDYLLSMNILSTWCGASDEALANYRSSSPMSSCSLDPSIAYIDEAHLKEVYVSDVKQNREGVKQLIKENGGVGIPIYASSSYYNKTNNTYYYYGSNSVGNNHAVTIIGWNDNIPAEYFTVNGHTPEGDGGWLIKNSWSGEDYAEDYFGYFYISYYDNKISRAYSFKYEPIDVEDNLYQYDGGMYNSYLGFGSTELTAANVYTVLSSNSTDELLDRISFSSKQIGCDYEAKIYLNPTDSEDPTTGTLMESATTTGVTDHYGINSVELANPVLLRSGDTFAIVLDLDCSYENVSLGVEKKYSSTAYNSVVSVSKGQSLFKKTGSNWNDIAVNSSCVSGGYGNFRIKAYTRNAYSINYELEGGVNSATNPEYYIYNETASFGPATREGYVFDGWYLDPEFGDDTKITNTESRRGSLTLYARWLPQIHIESLYKEGVPTWLLEGYDVSPSYGETIYPYVQAHVDQVSGTDVGLGAELCGYVGDELVTIPRDAHYTYQELKPFVISSNGVTATDYSITLYEKLTYKYASSTPRPRLEYEGVTISLTSNTDGGKTYFYGPEGGISAGSKLYLNTDAGSSIYYTLDGSIPQPDNSDMDGSATHRYDGPIQINSDTTSITAIAVGPLLRQSDIVVFNWTIKNELHDLGEIGTDPVALAELLKNVNQKRTAEGLEPKTVEELDRNDVPAGIWMAGVSEDGYLSRNSSGSSEVFSTAITYTDASITFAQEDLHIYYGMHRLIQGAEYKIAYKNNKKVYVYKNGTDSFSASSAPCITITGLGAYTGTLTRYFVIRPVSLSDTTKTQAQDVFMAVEAGNTIAQKGKPQITYSFYDIYGNFLKTVTLKEGTDYTLRYEGIDFDLSEKNKAAAVTPCATPGYDYSIVAAGKGNYAGFDGESSISCVEHLADSSQYTLMSMASVKIPSIPYDYSAEADEAGKWFGVVPAQYQISATYNNELLKGFYAEYVTVDGIRTQVTTPEQAKTAYYNALVEDSTVANEAQYIYYATNNRTAGQAMLHLIGIEYEGFTGIKSVPYTITGVSLSKTRINYDSLSQIYTGDAICPQIYDVEYTISRLALTLTLKGASQSEYDKMSDFQKQSIDYTYTYVNNTNVGKGYILFTGHGNYKGTVKKNFRITAVSAPALVDIGKMVKVEATGTNPYIKIEMDDTCRYMKNGAKPEPEVWFYHPSTDSLGTKTYVYDKLIAGKDYTLSYSGNKSVNDASGKTKPCVKLKFKGNFKGNVSENFKIGTADLGDGEASITATDVVFVSDKSGTCKPTVTLTDGNGANLKAGKDYIKPSMNLGSFTYVRDTLIQRKIDGVIINIRANEGETVSKGDIIPLGTQIKVTVNAKANSNYTGTISTVFKYVTASLSKAKVKVHTQEGKNYFVYSNKVIEPTAKELVVTVKSGKNTITLTPGTDYEIVPGSYKNNFKPGTGSVVIRGKGNYGNTKTVKFSIRRRGLEWWLW